NRFEIRLDPPQLGRIDVQLDIDRGGQVTSRLVVERADTLEHLRRDAADLQRALEQAGLKTADSGLQFALRDQGFAGRDASGSKPDATRLIVPDPIFLPSIHCRSAMAARCAPAAASTSACEDQSWPIPSHPSRHRSPPRWPTTPRARRRARPASTRTRWPATSRPS